MWLFQATPKGLNEMRMSPSRQSVEKIAWLYVPFWFSPGDTLLPNFTENLPLIMTVICQRPLTEGNHSHIVHSKKMKKAKQTPVFHMYNGNGEETDGEAILMGG